MANTPAESLLIDRTNLARVETRETMLDPDNLAPGQALLRIDHFGLTANNITYAALGDALQYWRFFPAPEGWGVIPVWGFAEVQASRCTGIEPGQRFYGYYPMATHLMVEPAQVSGHGFVDAAEHRRPLAVIYNQYLNTTHDTLYRADNEAVQLLLRPLFTTSFLLDDFLADNDFFGATRLVLTSASSKTATGLAYLLNSARGSRGQAYDIVGLTSAGNQAFVKGLGCYDQVLDYAALAELDNSTPTLIVDFAGNGELLGKLHGHLTENLRYSCLVGAAHWDQRRGLPKELPGPVPRVFFAPSQAEKRMKEWGREGFQQRLTQHWEAFSTFAGQWLDIEHGAGPKAVEQVYAQVLGGQASPQAGHVLTMHAERPGTN